MSNKKRKEQYVFTITTCTSLSTLLPFLPHLLDVPEPEQFHAQRVAVVGDAVIHVADAVDRVEHAARVLKGDWRKRKRKTEVGEASKRVREREGNNNSEAFFASLFAF